MTRRLISSNPLTGLKCWFDYNAHSDEMVLTHEQDVSPHLDYAAERRADPNYTQKGMKNDLWHYAHVPALAQMDMLQRFGVDFGRREDMPRVFELLNTEYKHLKVTDKIHNERN